jgi:hypothetical protein
MAIDILVDTVSFSAPEERVTGTQLLQLANLKETRELYRASRSGLIEVGKDDQFTIKSGDVFISKEKRREPFFVFNATTIAALIALGVSAFSLIFTVMSNREAGEHEAVKAAYDRFLDFSQQQGQFLETSHLFVLPDSYKTVAALVAAAFNDASPDKRARLLLKERAMANFIFTHFEATFYDEKSADRFWNSSRSAFQKEVLNYFTGRLLRNPRLLWYWDPKGGNLADMYESATIAYYNEHVFNDKAKPPQPDPHGPLGPP